MAALRHSRQPPLSAESTVLTRLLPCWLLRAGNFGTVFVDQSYWQGAIGAKPSATYKGYLLGGLCWFAVPFTMATSMGLAARAMNLPVTIGESNQGLVPPAVAQELMGAGGCWHRASASSGCARACGLRS